MCVQFAEHFLSQWVMRPRELAVMTPHMFLPVVGLALIPIGGASLGFKPLGTLLFGVSMVFWVMLFTMMLQRLFFLGVLPCKLVPSMFISVAPPCLVGVAYVKCVARCVARLIVSLVVAA